MTSSIFVFDHENIGINSEKCIEYASSDSQIDKPQSERPKS